MRSQQNVIAYSLTALMTLFVVACSDDSDTGEQQSASPSTTVTASDLSAADTAKAIEAVKNNWEPCLGAVGASSSSATVESIDDTKTGRPIDKGKRPVIVHVQWDEKEADFLVALEGHLTGAALFGDVSKALVAEAKAAGGGDC
jgi:hypothetical protein